MGINANITKSCYIVIIMQYVVGIKAYIRNPYYVVVTTQYITKSCNYVIIMQYVVGIKAYIINSCYIFIIKRFDVGIKHI